MFAPSPRYVTLYTFSRYQLNISQHYSTIILYCGDTSSFWHLNHVPTKPANDFYPLADIIYHGENLHDEHINILVAVKSVTAHSTNE